MNSSVAQGIWDHEIVASGGPSAEWLWHGFLARGHLTLLTGLWKAGKTTLLSLLLSRRRQGGTLAGLPVQPGKTAVISEESIGLWADRARQHDFGGNVCFFPQPFLGVPRPEQWQELLTRILELHDAHGIDLLVLDPLAPLFRAENNPRSIFETLLPLTALTRRGLAILATHHPTKGQPLLGQAARGSGALLGHVDISIEMRHPGGDPLTRRRRFLALSRHADTPRQLLLELNADGSDYSVLPDEAIDPFQASWPILHSILASADSKLSRDDLLELWPGDTDSPSPVTLRSWLSRAVSRGLVLWEGQGRRGSPLRYWLPKREAIWRQHPLYELYGGPPPR